MASYIYRWIIIVFFFTLSKTTKYWLPHPNWVDVTYIHIKTVLVQTFMFYLIQIFCFIHTSIGCQRDCTESRASIKMWALTRPRIDHFSILSRLLPDLNLKLKYEFCMIVKIRFFYIYIKAPNKKKTHIFKIKLLTISSNISYWLETI